VIRSERLRSVLGQTPLVLGTTMFNAVLVALVLAWQAGETRAWLWLAALLAVSLARGVGWWTLRRSTKQRRLWLLVIGGSVCGGVLWGALSLLTFPSAETYQLFVALVVGGMCAGSVVAYGAHFPAAAAFVLPASLPLAVRFGLEGQPLGLVWATLVVVFAGGMLRIGSISHRTFGALFRLQAELESRTASLDAAEARLQAEIAEHQATEAALRHVQKMEAIGQLTAGIAHDFNNMLTAIGGNLQLIRDAPVADGAIRRYAEAGERAVDRGAKLVALLLGFVQPAGATSGITQVNALLRDFLPLLRRAAMPCRMETRFAEDLPGCAVEAAQFQSAVLNLVINARAASPDGGTVTLVTALAESGPADAPTEATARPGRFVAVSVADTGSGMTEDVMARAFEPFFTTKPPGKGSGLGLAQVLSFARAAGGHATLASTPGVGTVVTLLLPAATCATRSGQLPAS
jgi:signal transduction histidine kinase